MSLPSFMWTYEYIEGCFDRAIKDQVFIADGGDYNPEAPRPILADSGPICNCSNLCLEFIHCWVDDKGKRHDVCKTARPIEDMKIFPYLHHWPCKCGLVVWRLR